MRPERSASALLILPNDKNAGATIAARLPSGSRAATATPAIVHRIVASGTCHPEGTASEIGGPAVPGHGNISGEH